MTDLLSYVLLAVTGAVSGVAARYASSALKGRGPLWARLHMPHFVFSLGIAPSILVLAIVDTNAPSGHVLHLGGLIAACTFPYALSFLATSRVVQASRRRRETSLPYEHWYLLRQRDPAAAQRFIAALWGQLAANRARIASCLSVDRPSIGDLRTVVREQLEAISAAQATLGHDHAGEPNLPGALAELQMQVERLRNDTAALLPDG